MGEIADAKDDFAGSFEASFARFQVHVEEACAAGTDWPSRVASAIRAALEFAAADPIAANVLTNDALAAGRDGISRHRRLLAYVAHELAPGREQSPHGSSLPPLTEQALAGGLAGIVAERLTRGRAHELPALAPEAIQFALTPYLGADEARRIAASG